MPPASRPGPLWCETRHSAISGQDLIIDPDAEADLPLEGEFVER
jgi:hypothetical protein